MGSYGFLSEEVRDSILKANLCFKNNEISIFFSKIIKALSPWVVETKNSNFWSHERKNILLLDGLRNT